MKSIFYSLTLLAFSLLFSNNLLAQTVEETPQKLAARETDLYGGNYSLLVVENDQLRKVRHILDYLLERAHDNAAQNMYKESAEELKLAASYMYVDAGRGHSQFQAEVYEAAENLSTMAADIDAGAKTPVNDIDAAIFNAHRALARYHQVRAQTLAEAHLKLQAGMALEAAALHYDHASIAMARLEGKSLTDTNRDKKVKEWEKLAQEMIANSSMSNASTLELIGRLGTAINELDAKS